MRSRPSTSAPPAHRWGWAIAAGRLRPFLALLLLAVIAGCGWFSPVDPSPDADVVYDIRSSAAIAAGFVTLSHGSGEVVSAVPLRSGLVVRAVSDGSQTRVAWVGTSALAGRQVQIGFSADEATWSNAEIVSAEAYLNSGVSRPPGTLSLEAVAAVVAGSQDEGATLAPLAVPSADDDELDPSFADFALGDLSASGGVTLLDAVLLVEMTQGAGSDARTRYLADLNGDYSVDGDDLTALLDKMTDPQSPSRLVVKPRSVPFIRLDADSGELPAVVLLGNGGSSPLAGVAWSDPGVVVTPTWTIAGQAASLALGEPADGRWLPNLMRVWDADGAEAEVRLGHLVVLVAGQSNASGRGRDLSGWSETSQSDPNVRMLGNDYRWKNASEPLDTNVPPQLDSVSEDTGVLYSFGTRLGNLLHEALGFTTYLIPVAKGGSCLWNCGEPPGDTGSWEVQGGDHLFRGSLIGSANYRALVAAGAQPNPGSYNEHDAESGPVNVIVWYQGESENLLEERAAFKDRTNQVLNSFGSRQFGGSGNARVALVQLASDFRDLENLRHNDIAERQRQLELERAGAFLIVTHDLPRSDQIHLSAFGQRELARRLALAIRQHVFGEDIDGTGPRPTGITTSGDRVFVNVDMPLVAGVLDHTMFTVFDGSPGSLEDLPNYGLNALTVTKAEVTAANPTRIELTLASQAPATPWVRHMPPAGRSHAEATWATIAPNMARAAGSQLPLPQFGPRSLF